MVQVLREHKNLRTIQFLTRKMTNLLLMKCVHLPDDDDEEEISTYGRKRNYEKDLITARLSAINSTGNIKVERTSFATIKYFHSIPVDCEANQPTSSLFQISTPRFLPFVLIFSPDLLGHVSVAWECKWAETLWGRPQNHQRHWCPGHTPLCGQALPWRHLPCKKKRLDYSPNSPN